MSRNDHSNSTFPHISYSGRRWRLNYIERLVFQKTELHTNLKVSEGYVPVCSIVSVGAWHQEGVILLEATDMLAVVRVG